MDSISLLFNRPGFDRIVPVSIITHLSQNPTALVTFCSISKMVTPIAFLTSLNISYIPSTAFGDRPALGSSRITNFGWRDKVIAKASS